MKGGIAILIAALLVSIAAFAQQSNQEKVICELSSRNCLKQSEVLQKRIKKLNQEIQKGDKKYSPDDLKKLEKNLKDTQETLDKLESGK